MIPRPRAFTVRDGAAVSCSRCGRRLLAGERAVVLREPDLVTYRHAGRDCPRPSDGARLARRLMTEIKKETKR